MKSGLIASVIALAALGFVGGACAGPEAHEHSGASENGQAVQGRLTAANAEETNLAGEASENKAGEADEASEAATHGDPALRSQARISPEQAQSAAIAARRGTVAEWELERETGGSGLRYSFVIRQNGAAYEVGIDARDGGILENAAEGDHPD